MSTQPVKIQVVLLERFRDGGTSIYIDQCNRRYVELSALYQIPGIFNEGILHIDNQYKKLNHKQYEITGVELDIVESLWQSISTAPMNGTIIMGKWEDDPDTRPQKVKAADGGWGITWFTPAGFEAEDEAHWVECIPPSHWQPIN